MSAQDLVVRSTVRVRGREPSRKSTVAVNVALMSLVCDSAIRDGCGTQIEKTRET